MYKLISLDLDGTLFNSDSNISDRNLNIVKKCRDLGVVIAIATGRPPRFTFSKIPDELADGYCICYNGARIYKKRKLIKEYCIKEEVIINMLNYFNDSKIDYKIALEINDKIYANFDISSVWGNVEFGSLESIEKFDKVCKLLIMNNEEIPFSEIKNKYFSDCYIIKTDGDRLIEIMDIAVTKYHAIMDVAKDFDIGSNEIIAFGDDYNDLEIIEKVGYGVAMGNANLDIKNSADVVTGTNDEDGVALVLEKLF